MMKRNKSNERQRAQKANDIRHMGIEQMASRSPSERAKEWFHRPAYQARKLVREQGEQIENNDMLDYLADKYDIKTGVSAGGQKDPE